MTYLAYFFIYSIIGWLIEVTYYFYRHKRYVNRGFLIGPLVPIYGFSAVFLHIIAGTVLNQTYSVLGFIDIVIVFFTITLVTSVLEVIGGALLFYLFSARWWDYSKETYNYKGFVSLKFSLIWGILGTALYLIVHIPLVVPLIDSVSPDSIQLTVQVFSIYVFFDAFITLIMLFNFKKWLLSLKSRLELLTHTLDQFNGYGDNRRLRALREAMSNALKTIRSNAPMDEVKHQMDVVKDQMKSVESGKTDKELSVIQRLMTRITSSHLYKGFPNLRIYLRSNQKGQSKSEGKETDDE